MILNPKVVRKVPNIPLHLLQTETELTRVGVDDSHYKINQLTLANIKVKAPFYDILKNH